MSGGHPAVPANAIAPQDRISPLRQWRYLRSSVQLLPFLFTLHNCGVAVESKESLKRPQPLILQIRDEPTRIRGHSYIAERWLRQEKTLDLEDSLRFSMLEAKAVLYRFCRCVCSREGVASSIYSHLR